MTYIHTVPEGEAEGKLREIYDEERAGAGYVPHHAQAISLNPDAIAAWTQLSRAIRSKMPLRRYELVTYAAALALKCHY